MFKQTTMIVLLAAMVTAAPSAFGQAFPDAASSTSRTQSTPSVESQVTERLEAATRAVEVAKENLKKATSTILTKAGYSENDTYEFNEHPELAAALVPYQQQLQEAQGRLADAKALVTVMNAAAANFFRGPLPLF